MSKTTRKRIGKKISRGFVIIFLLSNILYSSPNAYGENVAGPISVSNFQDLKNAVESITTSNPTKIILEAGEYEFTETLNIINKNIIFEIGETGQGNSTVTGSGTGIGNQNKAIFKRSLDSREERREFKKGFIYIGPDASLELNGRKNNEDRIIFDAGKKRYGFIDTEGILVINGAEFKDSIARHSTEKAPIIAKGKKALIKFIEGRVANNDYSGKASYTNDQGQEVNYSSNSYCSGAFYITEGARMVMDGGQITGNQGGNFPFSWAKVWASTTSTGAIMVNKGSSLIMNGGQIEGNKGWAGGVLVGDASLIKYKRDVTNESELIDQELSTAIFNGGHFSLNHGVGGGAISAYGNVDVRIPETSKLEIIKNIATNSGGGILVFDGAVDGVGAKKEIAKLPIEIWQKHYAGKLYMAGGTIKDNIAQAGIGGGIYVASNACHIVGGKIIDNYAGHYGGGIGVSTVPYTLKLESAYIADNYAEGGRTFTEEHGYILHKEAGGGIWFCPTGEATFNAQDGASIVQNKALYEGDEFWSSKKLSGGNYSINLANRLIGGTRLKHYEDWQENRDNGTVNEIIVENSNEEIAIRSQVEEDGKVAAKRLSNLHITGNKSSRGGGIGSNANIIFGKAPNKDNPIKDLIIKKTWQEGLVKEGVQIEVRAKIEALELDYLVERVLLDESNNFTFRLRDLPARVAGKNIEDILYLKEINSEKYKVNISKIKLHEETQENRKTFIIEIKNSRDIIGITANKVWEGGPDEKPPISLQLYRNAEPLGGPVSLENGQTEYRWEGLFLIDDAGNKYKYTVDEILVPDGYSKKIEGLTITNTHIPQESDEPDEPKIHPTPEEPGIPPTPEESETPPTPEVPEEEIPQAGIVEEDKGGGQTDLGEEIGGTTGIDDLDPPRGLGPKTGDHMPLGSIGLIFTLTFLAALGLMVYKKKNIKK